MQRRRALLLVGAVALAACGNAGAAQKAEAPPSRIVEVPNSNVRHIVLTERAIDRLGLETTPVAAGTDGTTEVPYSAVIYTPTGRTWVYAQVAARTFERSEVVVGRVDAERAVLQSGPAVGTPVVSVAAAEVYGTEFFSDHE